MGHPEYDVIPGFHSVREALLDTHAGIVSLWIQEGKRPGRLEELLTLARQRQVPVRFVPAAELARRVPAHVAHQGIAAMVRPFDYGSLGDLAATLRAAQGNFLALALDHITDEGNLGGIIRTAAFFGAHGLILPQDRSAQLTPNVVKRSAGGHLHVAVVRVVNLGRALDELAAAGSWIIGAAGETGPMIEAFDWNRDLVLVLGNEQRGLSPAIRKRCHALVRIERVGRVEALNVSVAGGVILAEILRQRRAAVTPS